MPVQVSDRTIDGPHGPLRVRVYAPTGLTSTVGVVWCHGGAFAYGDLDMPEGDWVARTVAESGIPVVSVDYQLAGTAFAGDRGASGEEAREGVQFPVASEEVGAAFAWAVSLEEWGVPAERWSLGGASAGANLTAGAALRLRDQGGPQPRSLVLAYPVVHAELPSQRPELAAKVEALPEDARFRPDDVEAINLNYVGDRALFTEPYAFAGSADLRGLPPTFVLNSDADDLRSSGELFASQLAAAGVDVLQIREDGTRHGHLDEPELPAAALSVRRIVAWLTSDLLVGVRHEPSVAPVDADT